LGNPLKEGNELCRDVQPLCSGSRASYVFDRFSIILVMKNNMIAIKK